jgi:hypothetical protein
MCVDAPMPVTEPVAGVELRKRGAHTAKGNDLRSSAQGGGSQDNMRQSTAVKRVHHVRSLAANQPPQLPNGERTELASAAIELRLHGRGWWYVVEMMASRPNQIYLDAIARGERIGECWLRIDQQDPHATVPYAGLPW